MPPRPAARCQSAAGRELRGCCPRWAQCGRRAAGPARGSCHGAECCSERGRSAAQGEEPGRLQPVRVVNTAHFCLPEYSVAGIGLQCCHVAVFGQQTVLALGFLRYFAGGTLQTLCKSTHLVLLRASYSPASYPCLLNLCHQAWRRILDRPVCYAVVPGKNQRSQQNKARMHARLSAEPWRQCRSVYTVHTRAVTCFLIGRRSRRWALPLLLPLAALGFSASRCWRGAYSSPQNHGNRSALVPQLLVPLGLGRLGVGGVVLCVFSILQLFCQCLATLFLHSCTYWHCSF